MHISHYLAKLIGPVLVLAAISMLIDPAAYHGLIDEFLKSPGLLYFSAIVGVTAGIALVLVHNVWVWDWRLIITLLGWISIADSITWLLIPGRAAAFWTPILEVGGLVPVMGIIVLLLGLVLIYYGYFAERSAREAA